MKPLSIECPNLTCIINQSWPGWGIIFILFLILFNEIFHRNWFFIRPYIYDNLGMIRSLGLDGCISTFNNILPCPFIGQKWFWTIQIVLVGKKMFWLGPNNLEQVQIRLFGTNFYYLDLSKMIWTWPKQIGPVQNDWHSTKIIWLVQHYFGPIEGQGIHTLRTYFTVIE